MMVLIRFWRSLTKKDSVMSARIETENLFSSFTPVLGPFLYGSRSGFFWIGSGFLADPDPDSKKVLSESRKKTGSKTVAITFFYKTGKRMGSVQPAASNSKLNPTG